MAETVSYKGYLSFNGEDEVRRFMIDKSAASSYDYLVEKVKTVFPAIRNKLLKISWTDDEGDSVTIASDEELMIALTEMTGPVYKVNIRVRDVIGGGSQQGAAGQDGGACNGGEGEEHPGVVCDGCEGPVRGYRYKCLVCQDFDLCQVCERKGLHPGHNMMRMSSAQGTWPHNLFRKINRMQERMEQRAKSRAGSEEKQQGGGGGVGAGNCGFQQQWGRGGRRGRGMWNGCGRGGFRPFGFQFGPGVWQAAGAAGTSGAADVNHEEAQRKAEEAAENAAEAAKAVHDAAHKAASASAAAAAAAAFTGGNSGEQYLRNIGEMVAAAMDPFGVDVDVSVETPDGVRTKVSSATASATTTTAASSTSYPAEQQQKDAAQDKEETTGGEQMDTTEAPEVVNIDIDRSPPADKEEDAAAAAAVASKAGSPSRETSSDEEDWTIVREDRKTPEAAGSKQLYPQLPSVQEATATAAADCDMEDAAASGQAAVGNGSQAGSADNGEEKQSAEAAKPEEARHPDPKIQVALQAMMNMGFSNEGGWLATLLEAKEGDIGKVLDLLQPVKK